MKSLKDIPLLISVPAGLKFLALILLFTASNTALAYSIPAVSFRYSSEFNDHCNINVEKSWIAEAKNREIFFQNLWQEQSPPLFDFFFKRFNRPFPHTSYLAKLSACPSTISYSKPLVLNISRFLKSYVRENPLNPDHAFIVLAFHELMHNWVEANLKSSSLLKKYSAETRDVKVHLHLMAIEQFVYTGLDRKDLLGWVATKYPSIGGDYARAWHIVNHEGPDAFLKELQQKNSNRQNIFSDR